MKVLEFVKSEFSMLGICLNTTKSVQRYSFNLKNSLILSVLIIGIILSCVHLLYIAKSFNEFTYSLYAMSSMLTGTICFAAMVWKMQPMSKYVDRLESTINKSEYTFQFERSFSVSFNSLWVQDKNLIQFQDFNTQFREQCTNKSIQMLNWRVKLLCVS